MRVEEKNCLYQTNLHMVFSACEKMVSKIEKYILVAPVYVRGRC